MDTLNYFEEIKRAKSGDEQSMLFLIERFDGLLKYYAKLLSHCYEDDYADLRCAFIALVKKFNTKNHFANNGAVVRYIEKSVRNSYIRISKKRAADRAVAFHNELSDEQVHAVENTNSATDEYSEILLESLKGVLTATEFKTLYRHYILDLSISEIATQDNTTRQTANITKVRALDKLKGLYDYIK